MKLQQLNENQVEVYIEDNELEKFNLNKDEVYNGDKKVKDVFYKISYIAQTFLFDDEKNKKHEIVGISLDLSTRPKYPMSEKEVFFILTITRTFKSPKDFLGLPSGFEFEDDDISALMMNKSQDNIITEKSNDDEVNLTNAYEGLVCIKDLFQVLVSEPNDVFNNKNIKRDLNFESNIIFNAEYYYSPLTEQTIVKANEEINKLKHSFFICKFDDLSSAINLFKYFPKNLPGDFTLTYKHLSYCLVVKIPNTKIKKAQGLLLLLSEYSIVKEVTFPDIVDHYGTAIIVTQRPIEFCKDFSN